MARRIEVEIVGDSSNLERAFKRSSASASRFSRDMGRAGRGAAAGSGVFRSLGRSVAFASSAFLGAAGFTAAVRAAFTEMADAEKVAAQTTAALKSTGGAANVSAKQIDTLATSLMNMSGVDDELIKGSENLLLTFTRVRNEAGKGNDVFTQATKAALDLSVRFGKDLASSAVLVGKALNDPVRGLTALRRVGVSFSKSQETLIKRLVASGRTLDAQKIILRELSIETGGAAEALGDTLGGKINILRESVLNLSGDSAGLLAPAIGRVVDQMTRWIQNTDNQKRVLDTVKQVAEVFTSVLKTLKGVMEGLNSVTGSTKRTVELLLGAFVAFKTARIVGTMFQVATQVGLIGRNARTSAGQVRGLGGTLARLGGYAAVGLIAAETQKRLFGKDPQQVGQEQLNALAKAGVPPNQIMKILRGGGMPRTGGPVTWMIAAAKAAAAAPKGAAAAAALPPMPKLAGAAAGAGAGAAPDMWQVPAFLQLQLAQAEALGRSLKPVLRRIRESARAALRSGKLGIQAQIDAWNEIASVNSQLAENGKKAKKAVAGWDLTPRRSPAFALAAGVAIHGDVHVHGVQNLRDFEDAIAQRAKARPHYRRGVR